MHRRRLVKRVDEANEELGAPADADLGAGTAAREG
jgi:hypothetical protein